MDTPLSPKDPRLDDFRNFKEHKKSERIIVEGELAVTRLLQAPGFACISVVAIPSCAQRLSHLAQARNIPLYSMSAADLRTLSGFDFHRGCVALAQRPQIEALQGSPWREFSGRSLLLATELADPRNVGAIIRNAKAFGVDAVVFDGRCACPFSRRAVRSSVGHCFSVPICIAADAAECITHLRATGFDVIAASLRANALPLPNYDAPERFAVVVGHEGRGLPEDLLNLCNRELQIPMQPNSDSVNVATASGIFLYHLSQRRRPGESAPNVG